MKTSARVIVIGGGISGLATAWWLHKAGIDVLVLEAGPRPGGTMQTVREDGWLIETGPNSALETTPLFRTLFADVGLEDQLVYANDAGNNRYIVRDGHLHALPMSPTAFLRSRLWSRRAKLRLLAEPFIGRAKEEETIAQFVRRRLGAELLDYAINPFVAGVYAGNPKDLSVRAAFPKLYALEEKYGGLITGQIRGARERKRRQVKAKDRARMFSFLDGMEAFPRAIAAKLGKRVLTSISVQAIGLADGDGDPGSMRFRIDAVSTDGAWVFECDAVVSAVPSYIAADWVEPHEPTLAHAFREIYYPPVAEVFFGYPLEQVGRPLDGFGFLVPEKEKRSILGTIWSSALFGGRAPEGHAAFTTFLGGARQPELTTRGDDELTAIVSRELASLVGTAAPPMFAHITRWPRAIPQYRLGHLQIVEHMERFEEAHPGFFLSGNFRGGISVGDCVISSDRVAQEVKQYLGE